ncbi:protein NYNRIN-like [Macrosteles quadrilineatus]|uniref:protein NYNRIN-like n=1 Tax=Macrosteles quadrilineatus TaxID=74068 RepID=UPI0023E29E52|nr:protein NYNRIN-like [Macrosteles quadrilineatus]
MVPEVTFLGYRVSASGVYPPQDRISALQEYQLPKTMRGLRRFLGMINFYRRFLPKAAELQAPLHSLLGGANSKGSLPVPWTPETEEAFQAFIDRYTRWPEVHPLKGITAEEVAEGLVSCWFSRYGAPSRITTDQGCQFESSLFKSLGRTFGSERIRTCSYHPCANGLVERFHRHLKASLMCHHNSSWLEALPIVLLGIRSAYREDIQASTAEIVFGQQLRLPGELFDLPVDGPRHEDPTDYVVRLRQHMSSIKPVQASRHVKPKTFIFQDLKKCTDVFLRDDSVKRALQPPYNGPYPVISRDEKSLVISQNGKQVRVSLNRVKPAYVL